jgi:type I restriction enzyme S subunit
MSSEGKKTGMEEGGKPALVPKLRFAEFKRGENWNESAIGSILAVRDERLIPSKAVPLFSLTIESGITEKTDRYNREFLVRDAGSKKYKLVKPNDLVYNPSNLRWGAISYSQLTHPVVVSPIYEVLYLNDVSQYFHGFIARAVSRDEQIKRFITKAQGTLVERIAVKVEDFLATELPAPPTLAEQKKVAECLNSLDELIAAQACKVDALKKHKKGLMQDLFPREGQTQPRRRFSEFRGTGEWTAKPLKAAAQVNPANKGLPESFTYIDLESVNAGELKAKSRISRIGAPSRAQRLLEHGDIIYQIVRPYQRNNLLCEFDDGDDYVASTGYAQLRAMGDNRFLYQSIHTDSFVNQVITKCTGSSYPAINSSDLAEIEISFPPTLDEQQKIAECLSSLDDLIVAESQKLEALNRHKRGLMQQLFPSPVEAEG